MFSLALDHGHWSTLLDKHVTITMLSIVLSSSIIQTIHQQDSTIEHDQFLKES